MGAATLRHPPLAVLATRLSRSKQYAGSVVQRQVSIVWIRKQLFRAPSFRIGPTESLRSATDGLEDESLMMSQGMASRLGEDSNPSQELLAMHVRTLDSSLPWLYSTKLQHHVTNSKSLWLSNARRPSMARSKAFPPVPLASRNVLTHSRKHPSEIVPWNLVRSYLILLWHGRRKCGSQRIAYLSRCQRYSMDLPVLSHHLFMAVVTRATAAGERSLQAFDGSTPG